MIRSITYLAALLVFAVFAAAFAGAPVTAQGTSGTGASASTVSAIDTDCDAIQNAVTGHREVSNDAERSRGAWRACRSLRSRSFDTSG